MQIEPCAKCDRAAYWRVLVNGEVVPLCDWHSYPRMPLAVRKRSFGQWASAAPSGTSPLMLPQAQKACGATEGRVPKNSLSGSRRARLAAERALNLPVSRNGQPVLRTQAFVDHRTGCLWCECGWQNESPGLLICEECRDVYELTSNP